MTTEDPTTETVETPAQVAEVTEVPAEEPFDKDRAMATINKLRETEKQAKQDRKELEQLKAEKAKRDEAEMTESQRNAKRAEEAEAKAAKLETDVMRRDVIAETGLPALFADRLKGTTKEEMLADAQELAKTLPNIKVPPKLPANNPGGATTQETDAQKRERLFGPQGNPFDLDSIIAKGGGVINTQK